jgi:hypothetical protein
MTFNVVQIIENIDIKSLSFFSQLFYQVVVFETSELNIFLYFNIKSCFFCVGLNKNFIFAVH